MSLTILESLLKELHLSVMSDNYRRLAQEDAAKIQYLQDLATIELEHRHAKSIQARMAAAHFPVVKTIATFDFSAQPDLPKLKVLDFLTGTFIKEKRNIVLLGPPGTGKTHLATAIGSAACLEGYRTLFTTAADLLMTLMAEKKKGRLKQRLKLLDRVELLIIDELGYIPFERESTDLLYQVISHRYECSSLIITTNLDFPNWTTVFPDAMAASAVVDRIVHYASVFEMHGTSYRLLSKQKSGKSTRKP